eukprot:c25030_g1_i1 orf=8-1507(-)
MHHIIGQPSLNGDYTLSSSLKFALKFCSSLAKVAEQRTWSAFPVTVILMEWLASQPKALQIICTEKAMGPIFSEFCEKVVALDMSIFSKNVADDLDHNAQMLQRDNISKIADKAQWEDHELLGFVPLANTHLRLDFTMQLPGYGVCDLATYSCWKFRYTDALQKLWNAVGQSDSGCLLKMPDSSNINLATEEANPTPSLKEWIEKTFFSADALTDLARAKQEEVQCNKKEVHLHDEAVSTVHDIANAGPCDVVQISSKLNVKSLLYEASMEMVMHAGEHNLEQCKDIDKPKSLLCETSMEVVMHAGEHVLEQRKDIDKLIVSEEQQLLTTRAVLMQDEISSDKADLDKVEGTVKTNSRKEACDYGCSAKPFGIAVPDLPNQTLPMMKISNKLPDIDKERISCFVTAARGLNRDLSGKHVGVISYLHEQQPIPSELCFDGITHVKPRGFIEAFPNFRHKYLLNSSIKHTSAASRFNGQLTWDNQAYATQNPFVLRLRKLS